MACNKGLQLDLKPAMLQLRAQCHTTPSFCVNLSLLYPLPLPHFPLSTSYPELCKFNHSIAR